MPESLIYEGLTAGDRSIDFSGRESGLFIGSNSTGFGEEQGEIPLAITTPFEILNLFPDISTEFAGITYTYEDDSEIVNRLEIQGRFEIDDFEYLEVLTGADLDFVFDIADNPRTEEENFIRIQNDITDFKGSLTFDDIPLPFKFEFDELNIGLETSGGQLDSISGDGLIKLPFRTERGLVAGLEITRTDDSFVIDSATLGLDGIGVPVPATPLFLERVQGTVFNLAPDDVSNGYTGGLGFTVGKKLTISPPKFFRKIYRR